MSSSSPNRWPEITELDASAFWLDSFAPLADDILSESGGAQKPGGNLQESTLHQQVPPSTDLSVCLLKQESEDSVGMFPSFSRSFGEEFNAPCASYTAPRALIESGYLKTDIAYASIFPPSADFYYQNPEAQHFAASSFPSREITPSQEQHAGIEESNVSVEYDNIGETQGFSGICKVKEERGGQQNIHLFNDFQGLVAGSTNGFGVETVRPPLPLPSPLPPAGQYLHPEIFDEQDLVSIPRPASTNNMRARVRARRGQATDPHSIAERLRREKISERMKNLRELVPHASKTDKASMLEEIIDYVRFLQSQVKFLSTSRLGDSRAIVIATEEKSGSRVVLDDPEREASEDNRIKAEKEVMELLETNVSAAMQFLQAKGLCLMPVALAAAIADLKSSSAVPLERKKDQMADGGAQPINGCGCRAKKENPSDDHNNHGEGSARDGNRRDLRSAPRSSSILDYCTE